MEPARAEKGGIEDFWSVRGGKHHDAAACIEAVHFHQQLIQGVFAFFMRPVSMIAAFSERVELVNKNEAGRLETCLLEKIADPRRSQPDEHFDEGRSADGQTRHTRFSGD